ncbi:MAG: S-layer homology domain-containing protein, partial [Oscillospiraceae bacterium]|nr:S-layer homology domain-containing protein [Oscillospiraceae bacterium]
TVTATYVVQESDVGTTVYNTIKATTGGEGDKENPEDTDEGTPIEKDEVVTEAEYTVEWYDAATGELIPLEDKNPNQVTRKGTVEETVEVKDTDKIVTGYTFDADNQNNVLSDTLKENGTVLKLYFTKDEEEPVEASYTVEWRDAETGELLPDSVKAVNPETRTGNIGDTVSAAAADKRIDGYTYTTVSGTIESTVLVANPSEDQNVLKLYFSKDEEEPVETSYTVEWRDAETGELLPDSVKAVNPETRTGNVGDTVSAAAADKRIDGYTYTTVSGTIESTVLVANPSEDQNVLKLYFSKDEEEPVETSYTVEWRDAETGELLPDSVKAVNPETRTGNVGDTVSAAAADKRIDGYTYTTVSGTIESTVLVTSPSADKNVLRLYFTKDEEKPVEASYTVEWRDAVTGLLLPSTVKAGNPEKRNGNVGETVNVNDEDKVVSGYTFRDSDTRNNLEVTLKEDAGENVLRLYFVRNPVTDPVNPNPDPSTPGPVAPVTPTPSTTPNTTDIDDEAVPLAAPGLNSVDHYAYIIGYTDGLVHPEANITRAEVATIFFRLMTDEFRMGHWATENDFPDVGTGNWFNNGVSTSASAGIVKGYEDGSFRPNRNITRAEFAAIAARFLSDEAAVSSSFSDISGHWAEKEINRAVMAGWIKGYTDGTFRPDQPITRAEAVTMINRMLDRTPDKDHLLPDMIRWPDNTEDKWYYADMQEATNSHDYERMEMVLIEDWTELLDNRDWEQLEKEWSTAASAPGKEVADNLDLSKIGENA